MNIVLIYFGRGRGGKDDFFFFKALTKARFSFMWFLVSYPRPKFIFFVFLFFFLSGFPIKSRKLELWWNEKEKKQLKDFLSPQGEETA